MPDKLPQSEPVSISSTRLLSLKAPQKMNTPETPFSAVSPEDTGRSPPAYKTCALDPCSQYHAKAAVLETEPCVGLGSHWHLSKNWDVKQLSWDCIHTSKTVSAVMTGLVCKFCSSSALCHCSLVCMWGCAQSYPRVPGSCMDIHSGSCMDIRSGSPAGRNSLPPPLLLDTFTLLLKEDATTALN